MLYDKSRVEQAKKMYPPGTRVELTALCNDEPGMPPGLRGTVVAVDDQPALLMEWDNGRTLALLVGEDRFFKVQEAEQGTALRQAL